MQELGEIRTYTYIQLYSNSLKSFSKGTGQYLSPGGGGGAEDFLGGSHGFQGNRVGYQP